MGAGVIPFALSDGRVHFLFQRVFAGRKSGFLNDFGGGLGENEDYRTAAMREFIEETETMFFADDIGTAKRTPEAVQAQLPIIRALFDATFSAHPDWWCARKSVDMARPKDWRSFFVHFDYQDVVEMNRAWELDQGARFKKRRELVWVDGDELLLIYARHPERLWKRVRQLDGAEEKIQQIQQALLDGR